MWWQPWALAVSGESNWSSMSTKGLRRSPSSASRSSTLSTRCNKSTSSARRILWCPAAVLSSQGQIVVWSFIFPSSLFNPVWLNGTLFNFFFFLIFHFLLFFPFFKIWFAVSLPFSLSLPLFPLYFCALPSHYTSLFSSYSLLLFISVRYGRRI